MGDGAEREEQAEEGLGLSQKKFDSLPETARSYVEKDGAFTVSEKGPPVGWTGLLQDRASDGWAASAASAPIPGRGTGLTPEQMAQERMLMQELMSEEAESLHGVTLSAERTRRGLARRTAMIA